MTEGSSGESHSGDDNVCGAAPRADSAAGESSSREADPSKVTRSAADEAKRQARIAAAKAAYLRTVRNESGQSASGSNDDRLLADRPPHWAPKSR